MKSLRGLTVLLAMFLAMPTQAGDKAHGGDAYAIEFTKIAKEMLNDLIIKNASLPGITLRELERKLSLLKISSVKEELYLDGKAKDALNYPTKLEIVFNRARWIGYNPVQRKTLVSHEVLMWLDCKMTTTW
jgi:hypothetical protein